LRGFQNRVIKRIGGYKREEVMLGWRNLDVEMLRISYCSSDIKVDKRKL
jgi:hypothetical protein